jgi:hypothetical protein
MCKGFCFILQFFATRETSRREMKILETFSSNGYYHCNPSAILNSERNNTYRRKSNVKSVYSLDFLIWILKISERLHTKIHVIILLLRQVGCMCTNRNLFVQTGPQNLRTIHFTVCLEVGS